jgi:hypothetical protein
MATQIQIASSGGAPTGFRYNIQVVVGFPPAPIAPSGFAYVVYYDNGEGGADYGGWSISNIDADGNDIGQFIFSNVNLQPFTVFTPEGTYCLANVQNATSQGGAYLFDGNQFVGVDPGTLNVTVGYFNFGTSVPFRPVDAGYTMAGNLNGTTITVGTSYIGIGSSTANATENTRSVPVAVTQGNIVNGYVKTAGVMTGSMQLTIMINGIPIGTPYTIPAGSAAGTYYFLTTANIAPNYPVSIRIVQSTATSSGVLGFGWTIK